MHHLCNAFRVSPPDLKNDLGQNLVHDFAAAWQPPRDQWKKWAGSGELKAIQNKSELIKKTPLRDSGIGNWMFLKALATLAADETLPGYSRYQCGACGYMVSFNERHLRVIREFGIEVLKPVDLLKLIGEIK